MSLVFTTNQVQESLAGGSEFLNGGGAYAIMHEIC